LAQWKPAYKRGYIMQSTLAIIGFVLGAAAWWLSGTLAFLLGAVLMLANWPWTLFGIMPTNRILMATELQSAGSASRALLVKWDRFMRYEPAWELRRPYHSCGRWRRQAAPAASPARSVDAPARIRPAAAVRTEYQWTRSPLISMRRQRTSNVEVEKRVG
jgi:hypothetical protein